MSSAAPVEVSSSLAVRIKSQPSRVSGIFLMGKSRSVNGLVPTRNPPGTSS